MQSNRPPLKRTISDAHQAWEDSLLRQVESLRQGLRAHSPEQVARQAGCGWDGAALSLAYWGQPVQMAWPALQAEAVSDGADSAGAAPAALPVFDQALLLYYLHTADGAAPAQRWASFRELPGGAFYHQAFQSYSSDPLAAAFSGRPGAKTPEDFASACQKCGGRPLAEFGFYTFAFQALPRLPLGAVLWPGDEEFPARAGILFDAAGAHYLPVDGLALLGSRLARKIMRAL